MGVDIQENDIKRSIFSIHGITGYLIAVVGLVATLLVLGVWAVSVQTQNAETYYSLNQDIHAIKAQSLDNLKYRTVK